MQFAKYCEQVISFEIDAKIAKQNYHFGVLQGVSQKIEVIHENFFMVRNMKVDLVFINPDVDYNNGDFSIFKHLVPNISTTLNKALHMSKNIVLLLPK